MSHYNSTSLRTYKGVSPTLQQGAYVDPAAIVIGDVELGEDASVWPLVVIRADVNRVRIGDRSNIQDGTVIHESRPRASNPSGYPTLIGTDVTIGHKVMLHGCVIGNRVLVGMGAIILDGAIIEDEVIIGAGALVTPGKRLLSGYLYTGSPARQARPLRDGELAHFVATAENYVTLKNDYLAEQE
ncbi:MAG: carbonic anhydrase/acetyltransferase-like protein (isoleucine patch superfamily) [Oceanicoccus sp.]|jgi:carbonic anhydrase/acetyltransferase-like protein (isoleucine patch superfamily)